MAQTAPTQAREAPTAEQTLAAAKKVGKFSNGDHMVHLLIQKGKKFISNCKEDR